MLILRPEVLHPFDKGDHAMDVNHSNTATTSLSPLLQLPDSVLSSILLLCNKQAAAAAMQSHRILYRVWHGLQYI
eukprot:jgi/Chrzof1/5452/Cz16g03180.t1